MKLQNLTVIFIIIILPIVIVLSAYVGYEIKTIQKQNEYNMGLQTATHDAIFSFEMNTRNDAYSNNAENKRNNIKAAVKTFENSLSTACNLDLYNNDAIEEYIPAILFGLYDGFYMYAPSQTQSGEYQHNLRNYVYYSEEIKEGDIDIIIRYTLDNYIAVSGTINGTYVTRAGYLINLNDLANYNEEKINPASKTITYKGLTIEKEHTSEYINGNNKNEDEEDLSAVQYYKDAYAFTYWFIHTVKIGNTRDYLKIDDNNDPEDESSAFVKHKRAIMQAKIEETLNSSITAYANKTRNNYKMPKLKAEDWEKVYQNISVITFVQGMNLGFKSYNQYCILNSTNNQEYVNPNLIYFTDGNSYHDIRCSEIANKKTTGYKIGSFEKITYETQQKDSEGNVQYDAEGNAKMENQYYYKHNELACYKCINGTVSIEYPFTPAINLEEYLLEANDKVLISYYSALARERYKTIKLLNSYNAEYVEKYNVTYDPGTVKNAEEMPEKQSANFGTPIQISKNIPKDPDNHKVFLHWETSSGGTYYPSTDEIPSIITGYSNITLTAVWADNHTITYHYNGGTKTEQKIYNQLYYIKSIEQLGITRDGYDFIEWNTRSDGKGTSYDVGSLYQEEQDLNLYAQWKSNEVTISYYVDGTLIEDKIVRTNEYMPTDILYRKENYEDKMLLGYRINQKDIGISYNETISVNNYAEDGKIRLDAIYINSNSIIWKVNGDSQSLNTYNTNIKGKINVTIQGSNKNGNPKLFSKLNSETEKEGSSITYNITADTEKTHRINVKMVLHGSYNVSRQIEEEYEIIIDYTKPTIDEIVINGNYVYANVSDNEGGSGIKLGGVFGKYLNRKNWITVPMEMKVFFPWKINGKSYYYRLYLDSRPSNSEISVWAEDLAGNKSDQKTIK